MVDLEEKGRGCLMETNYMHPLGQSIERANYEFNLMRGIPNGIGEKFSRWRKVNKETCPGIDNAFIVYEKGGDVPGLVVGTNMHEHKNIFDHSLLMRNPWENIISCYSIRTDAIKVVQVNQLGRIKLQGVTEEGGVCYINFAEVEDFEGSGWNGRGSDEKFEIVGPNYKRVAITK